MCVIIDRPGSVPIDEDLLWQAMEDNRDGWGIMYSDGTEVLAWCGMEPETFWEAYEAVDPGVHATLHFRYATHGTVDEENCHPFLIRGGDYAVMHNGIISVLMPQHSPHSDTWHWAHERLARHLEVNEHRFAVDDRFTRALEKSIGGYNKVVVLRNDGERLFLNRGQGTEHEGLWLSNGQPLRGLWGQRWRDRSWYDGKAYAWSDPDPDADWLKELDDTEREVASALVARAYRSDWRA